MGIKGQTSMIAIVLIIIIFMAIGIFLLISSIKPEYDEYYNLYAHNLLLSVLRSNTGYGGYCDTISSTLACAYMTSYRRCGDTDCRNLSATIVPALVEKVIKDNLDYCIIVEPENRTIGGERVTYGEMCDTVIAKTQKWTANEKILQEGANLNIMMVIAEG